MLCTDTRFTEQLIDKLEGVKLLYHETTFMHDLKDRADKTGHSTNELQLLQKSC